MMIDARGTIRRFGYRSIVMGGLANGNLGKPAGFQSARDALLLLIKRRVTDWPNFVESGERSAIERRFAMPC
jgi:hypothetical protein